MLLVCPIPGVDYEFNSTIFDGEDLDEIHFFVSDYIYCFMFVRFYFAFKWRFLHDIYNDAFSKQLCKNNGFYPNFWFLIKTRFVKRPQKTVFIIFIVSVFTLSYWIYTFEIDNLIDYSTNRNEPIYFNAIYFIMITMTTVGYGDIFPKTLTGKIIIMFTAVWGAVMISFVVLMVSNAFNMTDLQERTLQQID